MRLKAFDLLIARPVYLALSKLVAVLGLRNNRRGLRTNPRPDLAYTKCRMNFLSYPPRKYMARSVPGVS